MKAPKYNPNPVHICKVTIIDKELIQKNRNVA